MVLRIGKSFPYDELVHHEVIKYYASTHIEKDILKYASYLKAIMRDTLYWLDIYRYIKMDIYQVSFTRYRDIHPSNHSAVVKLHKTTADIGYNTYNRSNANYYRTLLSLGRNGVESRLIIFYNDDELWLERNDENKDIRNTIEHESTTIISDIPDLYPLFNQIDKSALKLGKRLMSAPVVDGGQLGFNNQNPYRTKRIYMKDIDLYRGRYLKTG